MNTFDLLGSGSASDAQSASPHPPTYGTHRQVPDANPVLPEPSSIALELKFYRLQELVFDLQRELSHTKARLDVFLNPCHASNEKGERILAMVAAHYHLDLHAIKGRLRPQRIVVPRWTAIWLIRQLTDMGNGAIGRLLHQDSSTIDHALHAIEERRKKEPKLREEMDRIFVEVNRQLTATPNPESATCASSDTK